MEPGPEPLEARQEFLRRHAPGGEGHFRLSIVPGPVLIPEAAVHLHLVVDGRSGKGGQDARGHPVDAEGFAGVDLSRVNLSRVPAGVLDPL